MSTAVGNAAAEITDEDRQRMMFRKALARKKRKDREAAGEIRELNITAMMDMMTIILVFLLKSFASSSAAITASEDVRPPVSSTRATPKDTVAITITPKNILVGDREVVRAARPAVEQLDADLGPGHEALDELVVEHRQARRLQDDPADLGVDVRALLVPAPRPHDVAMAEQLDATAAEHVDLAAEQAVHDEEAAVVDTRLDRRGGVPRAGREPAQADERIAGGPLGLRRGEDVGEVGIRVDDAHDARVGRHRGAVVPRPAGALRQHADVRRPTAALPRAGGRPYRRAPSTHRKEATCSGSSSGSCCW